MEARVVMRGTSSPASAARTTARALVYYLLPIVAVALVPLLPFVNNYIIAAVVRALIFISLGQAWNIVAGIGGQLSLGHGVFLGLGCYTTGILFNRYGIPPWIGGLAAMLLSLAVAFVVTYFWITRWILSSSFGLQMQAVRDDEVAAAAAGVAVFRTKLLGFMLSAAMTSLAAVLYLQYYMAIDPEAAFGLAQAIQLQLPALLGGLGTALGPIVGGAVMVFLSEVTNWASTKIGIDGLDVLVYGLMLLIVVLRAPNGIVGLIFKNAVAGGSR